MHFKTSEEQIKKTEDQFMKDSLQFKKAEAQFKMYYTADVHGTICRLEKIHKHVWRICLLRNLQWAFGANG